MVAPNFPKKLRELQGKIRILRTKILEKRKLNLRVLQAKRGKINKVENGKLKNSKLNCNIIL